LQVTSAFAEDREPERGLLIEQKDRFLTSQKSAVAACDWLVVCEAYHGRMYVDEAGSVDQERRCADARIHGMRASGGSRPNLGPKPLAGEEVDVLTQMLFVKEFLVLHHARWTRFG
jgi:hypothetical protein